MDRIKNYELRMDKIIRMGAFVFREREQVLLECIKTRKQAFFKLNFSPENAKIHAIRFNNFKNKIFPS